MSDTTMVRCKACGTLNRVPAEKAGLAAKCGSCKAALHRAVPIDLTDATFDSHVRGSDRPVLIEFWSPNCGHCIRMSPVMDELAAELAGKLVIAKLDVARNPAVASRYAVNATPAFVVVKDGREAARFLGAMPKDELLRQVQTFIR